MVVQEVNSDPLRLKELPKLSPVTFFHVIQNIQVKLIGLCLIPQVKESGAVVLSGAYVDLHAAADGSPQILPEVHQSDSSCVMQNPKGGNDL